MQRNVFLFFVLIMAVSCSQAEPEKEPDFSTLYPQAAEVLNDVEKRISYCDSFEVRPGNSVHTRYCFDSAGRVVRKDSANLFESHSQRIFHYSMGYDASEKLIYSQVQRGFELTSITTFHYDTTAKTIESTMYRFRPRHRSYPEIKDTHEYGVIKTTFPLSDTLLPELRPPYREK